jgi:hypothetical protein
MRLRHSWTAPSVAGIRCPAGFRVTDDTTARDASGYMRPAEPVGQGRPTSSLVEVKCPGCGDEMEEGALAINGARLLLTTAVWEPVTVSFRGSKKVLSPGPLGLHTRVAWRCPTCETLVIPPEEKEERLMPYVGRSLARADPGSHDERGEIDRANALEGPATWESFAPPGDDPLRP